MAITSDYNKAKMQKELDKEQELSNARLFLRIIDRCEQFIEEAKTQPQGHSLGFYNDQTKALRQSIAAYIFRDGKLVWSKVEGNAEENMSLILEESIPREGFFSIVIAGKIYASWVESKGYNVISLQGRDWKKDSDNLLASKKW
jgi:hypothetical protein